MPETVVNSLAVYLERSSVAAATRERQVPAADVSAGHVGRVHVANEEYQSGTGVRPEVNVQRATVKRHKQLKKESCGNLFVADTQLRVKAKRARPQMQYVSQIHGR
jgi:hypothetical protein